MQKPMPEKNKRWNAAYKRIAKDRPFMLAEVGVWQPKFSKAIMPYAPKLKMLLIDRWCTPPKGDTYSNSQSEISEKAQQEFDKAFKDCQAVAKLYQGRITLYKMDSVKAAACLPDRSLDMVFIDGDHSYEGCKRDILAYLPKVKKGGWIGGHDYAHPNQGEVKKAVDEFMSALPEKKLELDCNNTWWVRL